MMVVASILFWLIAALACSVACIVASPIAARVRFGRGVPLFVEGWFLHPMIIRVGLVDGQVHVVLLNHWLFGDGGTAESSFVNNDPADTRDSYWNDNPVDRNRTPGSLDDSAASFHPADGADAVNRPRENVCIEDALPGDSFKMHTESAEINGAPPFDFSEILRSILGLPLLLLKVIVSLFEGVTKCIRSIISLYVKIRELIEEGARWLAFFEEHTTLYKKSFRWLVRLLRAFFGIVRVDEGIIRIESGLGNPFHTGLLCAAFAPFLGSSNASRRMEFVPDFSDTASFSASGSAVVRTSIALLLWPFVVAILTFPWLRALWFYWRFRRFRAAPASPQTAAEPASPAS